MGQGIPARLPLLVESVLSPQQLLASNQAK